MSAGAQLESTLEEALAKRNLVRRILASRHFIKAPLLSSFLEYVCQRSMGERASRISEQEIGTYVFGREPGYDSREDNIVRNYARQLRRRLDDYYAMEGREETLRIEIPKGGYVPLFLSVSDSASEHLSEASEETSNSLLEEGPGDPAPESLESSDFRASSYSIAEREEPKVHTAENTSAMASAPISRLSWVLAMVCLAFALGASVTALSLVWTPWPKHTGARSNPNHALWEQLFTANRDTLIVPADTALVTVEDMNQRQYSLTEYLSWSSVEYAGQGFDTGLRIRKYTDIESLEIANQLVRLPEWKPDRAFMRTASNLHVEDLRDDNLILIGSIYSIPWIQVLDNNLNFRLVYEPKFGRAHIENRHPAPGEAGIYANQWNGVNETDYAVLALIPNLNHTGQILMLEGLDGAGMYAVNDVLFGDRGLQDILQKCVRPDGSLRMFEALLESTSVDSHSTAIRIVSVHMLD